MNPVSVDAENKSIISAFLEGDDGHDHGSEDGLSYKQHLVAGAIAGITEHCLIFPIDTIKTRMQVLGTTHTCVGHTHGTPIPAITARATAAEIVRREGIRKLFRGVSAMALGAGPSHAVYFAVYEQMHAYLGADQPGHHPLANGVSGVLATVVSDALFTPMDTIKQRLQVENSPYRNVGDVASRMFRQEGIRAFYASYGTSLVMNVPFTFINFVVYHTCKEFLQVRQEDSASLRSVTKQLACGGAAGAVAAAFTNPLDVVRTRLQTQGLHQRRYSGMVEATRDIMACEGARGFSRGWAPRVLFHIPGAAICWATYEFCKDMFGMDTNSHQCGGHEH